MPQIQDILGSFHGATVFSTLYLKSGYWQPEMEEDCVQKTVFVTSAGLFEFLAVTFWPQKLSCLFSETYGDCIETA